MNVSPSHSVNGCKLRLQCNETNVSITEVLSVAVAGGCGAALRHIIYVLVPSSTFPTGTLIVNASGSFLLGVLIGFLSLRADISPTIRLLCGTGFLGAFTTYSTFSVDSAQLILNGDHKLFIGNVVAQLVLGIGFALAGIWVGSNVLS